MNDVTISNGGTTITNKGIDVYRMICIRQGVEMHQKFGMIPTRGVTITKLLGLASGVTGKKYKRGGHSEAIKDLNEVIAKAKESLTIVDER